MKKTALLFSGQGSQYVGMGKDLYDNYPLCRELYSKASDIFGFDVAKMSFEGNTEEISQTLISQPLIYTHSIAAYFCKKEEFEDIVAVGGHSLGEYAALTAAEVFTLEDGFKVIKARARAMQTASEKTSGAMVAVMGLGADEIQTICDQVEGYVLPVNFNCPTQTVIAGEVEAIEKAIELFSAKGVKTIKLAVNSAFHSNLMQSASDEFRLAIADIAFDKPKLNFYSNLTGKILIEPKGEYLAQHLVSPVLFTTELQNMFSEQNVDRFFEVGPNKVLSGLVKKTLKGISIERTDS